MDLASETQPHRLKPAADGNEPAASSGFPFGETGSAGGAADRSPSAGPNAPTSRSRRSVHLRRIREAFAKGWGYFLLGGVLAGLAGFMWGDFSSRYEARAELIRNPLPELLADTNLVRLTGAAANAVPVLTSLATSPESLQRVLERAAAATTADKLAGDLDLTASPGGETLLVRVVQDDSETAVRLARAMTEEVVLTGKELQTSQVREAVNLTQERILLLERELNKIREEIGRFRFASGLLDLDRERATLAQRAMDLETAEGNLQSRLQGLEAQLKALSQSVAQSVAYQSPELLATRQELARSLAVYTEEHPKVKALRVTLAALEAEASQPRDPATTPLTGAGMPLAVGDPRSAKLSELQAEQSAADTQLRAVRAQLEQCQTKLAAFSGDKSDVERLCAQYQPLKKNRDALSARHKELQILEAGAASCYRVLVPASLRPGENGRHLRRGLGFGLLGAVMGVLLTGLVMTTFKLGQRRARTAADLEAATGLPILATLGDLSRLTTEQVQQWAFETFLTLRSRLAHPEFQTLVCGFTSLHPREGRSTWIRLLAEAARRQGYRVLTLDLGAPPSDTSEGRAGEPSHSGQPPASSGAAQGSAGGATGSTDWSQPEGGSPPQATSLELMLPHNPQQMPLASTTVLAVSRMDWSWSISGRQAWQQFLAKWNDVDNCILFVELPPVTRRETVLLAERFPNLVWLCRKDTAAVTEIRSYLTMLKQARANLVGSVLNDVAPRALKPPSCGALIWVFLAALAAEICPGGEPAPTAAIPVTPPPALQVMALSAAGPAFRADWQKRLTLGPGDILDISLFDQPESVRPSVTAGPDGRITYLQARDILIAGLTVDELRERLEKELAKYFRSPRVLINPIAYRSKKYCVLGSVAQKGIYDLDQPLTILEAVARARGFEVNAQNREVLLLSDLAHSFLVRKTAEGKYDRVNVDFEALFLRGDLSQNVAVAPDDYLYFPPLDLQQVYVLGQVASPGAVPYSGDISVLRAIISRGGFLEGSWKRNVLVIRGSLTHPQTFVVRAGDILAAKAPDFPLKPGDIVYINRNPWYLPTELLKNAALDFARSVVVYWTGEKMTTLWN